MPYTVHDTPAVVARIENDLSFIEGTVCASDPSVKSLILTGGFARGEGAMFDGQPQNDYDLVAIRGVGRPRRSYEQMSQDLGERLGLHIDLAPVPSWRLPWVARSIFWYETALRGKVLYGPDLRSRIPIQSAGRIDPAEGLRLLTNRAAGLLLALQTPDPHARRLQAAKALLAAADAHLLAAGTFAPSQTERREQFTELRGRAASDRSLVLIAHWAEWAYHFKVDPANAPLRDPEEAWRAAANAILDAVPVALRHARLPSLEAYGKTDGLVDHWIYFRRSARVPGARRWALHPTGRVRVGTLRLLEASLDGRVRPEAAQQAFCDVANVRDQPLRLLDALRHATLQ